ncbi:MAG: S41 family peptidase [Ruminococcaceae bacterium]|nr:S41 family peptidase [Oscillospiraceae bacterium]
MKKTTAIILLIIAFLSGSLLGICLMGILGRQDAPALAKANEVYRVLDTYFIGEVDEDLMCDTVAEAMVYATGDQWSYYISAEDYDEHLEQLQNAYVGIGVSIRELEDGSLQVLSVTPNSPAEEGGMQPGDIFVAVNGEDCTAQTLTEVREKVRGEAGTDVTITVLREEERIDITMTRASVEAEVVRHQMMGDTGYIAIFNFDATAADKTIAAIEELRAQGAKSLLFDVRFNPGGLKTELLELLDYLLPEGPIFRSEDYLGREEVDESDAACLEMPMAVLINQDSYSAAEFFAAALSEYGVAGTVGTQTCGKGYFQVARPLSDGSALNISVGKYYTPNGVSLADAGGLAPDYVVELPEEEQLDLAAHVLAPEDDPQLQKALSLLK